MFNDSILPRENSRLLYDGMKSTIGSSDIFPTQSSRPEILLPVKVLKGAAILFFSSGPMLAKNRLEQELPAFFSKTIQQTRTEKEGERADY